MRKRKELGHDVEGLSEFRGMDFSSISRGSGGHGVRVEDPGKIGTPIREALDDDGPTAIDVVIDTPPWRRCLSWPVKSVVVAY